MDRNGQDQAASEGAQRVRERRAAGLVEIKAWVRAQDVERAHAALRPLTEQASRDLARHLRQGRSNQIAVELRFPGLPPARFREQLRQGWGLVWDREGRCWRGLAGDAGQVEELRRLAAVHSGQVLT